MSTIASTEQAVSAAGRRPTSLGRLIMGRLVTLIVVALIAALVVLVDGFSKHWAQAQLPALGALVRSQVHQPLFLAFGYNDAVRAGFGAVGPAGFIAGLAALPAFGLIMLTALGTTDAVIVFGLGLLTGGGFGNGLDRLVHGRVVDFIGIGGERGMLMNLADLAMFAGLALLMASVVLPVLIEAVVGVLGLAEDQARPLAGHLPGRRVPAGADMSAAAAPLTPGE